MPAKKDIKDYSVDEIRDILAEAAVAAIEGAQAYVDDWTAKTGGNQYGEPMCCGFASTVITGVKGNTKVGKALKAAGVRQDYTRSFSIYNPSNWRGQSIDVKEAGARAHADVLNSYGFDAYPQSRMD